MANQDETRNQVEEDAIVDLQVAQGDAEGIVGGGKAKKDPPVKYLEVKMNDVVITSVSE